MVHARNPEPQMLRHARWNRAFAVIRDEHGHRRQVTLGAWPHDGPSPEARRAYHALLARWHAEQRGDKATAALAGVEPDANLTVADAAARWLAHCEVYYRHPDGTPTSEVASCSAAVDPLVELYPHERARDFSCKKLKVVRDRMVRGDPTVAERRGWCRTLTNQATGRIRRMFKWLVSEELVPVSVHAALCTLPPLKRGRTDARESKPTRPVSDADVTATLPHLPAVVADMVRLQFLVGMRPIELCTMTTAEIDRSESIEAGCWVFRPAQSKLSYRGRAVEYVLGPQAVVIVRAYLKANPAAPLFSPTESEQKRCAEMRERRRSKVQPSQVDRRLANPQHKPRDRYDTMAYGHAVRRGAKRAGLEVWSPHALRRAVATRIRAKFGAEAARAALAHQTLDMTALYAHRDLKAAAQVAKAIG